MLQVSLFLQKAARCSLKCGDRHFLDEKSPYNKHNDAGSFRMSFVQMKSQETCVRQRVLKKMFVCGLSFSNLFDEMEPRAEGGNPVKCK